MSMDFTTTFFGPPNTLTDLLIELDACMGILKASRVSAFFRAAFEPQRGVVDEVEEDEQVFQYSTYHELDAQVSEWQGASATYQCNSLTVYVLVYVTHHATYCWVDVSDSALRSLAAAESQSSFYSILTAIARWGDFLIAMGCLEGNFEPMNYVHILKILLEPAQDLQIFPCIGLILKQQIGEHQLLHRISGRFSIQSSTPDYWILEEERWFRAVFLKGEHAQNVQA